LVQADIKFLKTEFFWDGLQLDIRTNVAWSVPLLSMSRFEMP
jgi:hypothetical protein